MTQVHRVPVEKMTEKAFRPFGQLMLSKERPPYEGVSYRLSFQAGKVRIGTNWLPYKGFRFTGLEQHLHVSQSFVHLQGAPAVVAVAAPTDPSAPDSIPKPEDVHVFLIEPHTGYLLKRGTWHSDRLPLYAPGSMMVIITDVETNRDLQAHGGMTTPPDKRGGWKWNRIVDYEYDFGVEFEIVF